MTHGEMLKRMGLTEDEFTQLLMKFRVFYASLSPAQKAVVNRTLPTLRRAARSLGSGVTAPDLRVLLTTGTTDSNAGTFGQDGYDWLLNQGNGDDDDGDDDND